MIAAIPFRDEAEAIAIANDSDFGLYGYVWTADHARGMRVARALRTGTVQVNSGAGMNPDAPFGGYKRSGIGHDGGLHVLLAHSELKYIGWDAVLGARVNLAHLLVGSEGTLAYTKRLHLNLAPLPRHKALGVVHFPTFHRAMDSAQHIVKLKPVAVEMFGGRFDPALLRFPMNKLAGSEPASDIRDWNAISEWANSIATKFEPPAA